MEDYSFELRAGDRKVKGSFPENELLYHISPKKVSNPLSLPDVLKASLNNPIGVSSPSNKALEGSNVTIIADDLTRPTPQKEILPHILDHLNEAGVEDRDITVLVALGTHRYMEEDELVQRFGEEIVDRVNVINHRWRNNDNLVELGETDDGIPIEVNRKAVEADYLMGVGSIVPHVQAGWGGGCKILQPGICSDRTTQETHLVAAEQEDYLGIAGHAENPVRDKIEEIALKSGLDFIVNVVFDREHRVVDVVSGHPVEAHRRGVEKASDIFVRDIPDLADIVIVEARPAEVDYWQGIKALAYAQHGVGKGGKTILVAGFEEGVSPVHTELIEHADQSPEKIWEEWESGKLEDGVGTAALLLHVEIINHSDTICVSQGLTKEGKEKLGFRDAGTLQEAIEIARSEISGSPKIGVIEVGGDVLPKVSRG